MHAGRVDGVYGVDTRQHGRNYVSGQFVDQFAEARVFLRRASNHGEGPDRPFAMVDPLDPEDRDSFEDAAAAVRAFAAANLTPLGDLLQQTRDRR